MKTHPPSRQTGFGLIDAALGIIAGIGLIVGAVLLFQQVIKNNTVSEITQNATSISSQIRAASRNMENLQGLSNDEDPPYSIDLDLFGMDPASMRNQVVTAAVSGISGQQFTLVFERLDPSVCQRAGIAPGNLGVNVASAICNVDGGLEITYNR